MIRFVPLAAALLAAQAVAAGPLEVTSRVFLQQQVAAPDGTMRVQLVPAARVTPGDRLTVVVSYRNAGRQPIADLAIVDPVPAGLAYRGGEPGAPVPDVSVDGSRFGPLGGLAVAGRPAGPADVTHVRWRVAGALAPGAGGRFAFQAVLK